MHLHQPLERLQFEQHLTTLVRHDLRGFLRPVDARPARDGISKTPHALVPLRLAASRHVVSSDIVVAR